jgi:hypothetical protein
MFPDRDRFAAQQVGASPSPLAGALDAFGRTVPLPQAMVSLSSSTFPASRHPDPLGRKHFVALAFELKEGARRRCEGHGPGARPGASGR